MANEAAVTANIIFESGYAEAMFSAISLPVDVAGDDYVKTNMTVGTGATALVVGGVSSLGGIMVGKVREGSAATVSFYIDTETEFLKFKSGDPFILRFAPGSSVLVKGSQATEIEYLLLEA